MALSDKTQSMVDALEGVARAYGSHSGPQSTSDERAVFGRDLRAAALRYARAYYAEAREHGLVPEYQRVDAASPDDRMAIACGYEALKSVNPAHPCISKLEALLERSAKL